jgi:hypothetical protein
MPEWLFLIAFLAALSLLGLAWAPLRWAFPFFGVALALPIGQALLSASRGRFTTHPLEGWRRFKLLALTAGLHLLQPVARLRGRLRHGLTPWRRRGPRRRRWQMQHVTSSWRETWKAPEARLTALHDALQQEGCIVQSGGDYADWDLGVRGGLLGGARFRMAVEEHGAGRQMLRFRSWMRLPWPVLVLIGLGGLGTAAALGDGARFAALVLGGATLLLLLSALRDGADAMGAIEKCRIAAESDERASP